jgi:hypothetical protein
LPPISNALFNRRFFSGPFVVAAALALYAVASHFLLIYWVPDPIFQPDSGSYVDPALSKLSGGPFSVAPHRTLGYPIFVYFPLKVFRSFTSILVLQHAAAIAAAWLVASTFRLFFPSARTAGWVLFAAILLTPKNVLMPHSLLTESLYGFFMAAAFAASLRMGRLRGKTSMVLMGVSAGIARLVRPVGRGLAVSLMAAVLTTGRRRPEWKRALGAYLISLAVVFVACAAFYENRGFWKEDRFAGVSLFGTTAQYLSAEDITDPRIRSAMIPALHQPRIAFKDANWVRFSKEGPVQALAPLQLSAAASDALLSRLALKAVASHPFRFVADQVGLFMEFVLTRSGGSKIFYSAGPMFFLCRGLELLFLQDALRLERARPFLSHPPEFALSFLSAVRSLREVSDEEVEKRLRVVISTSPYRFDLAQSFAKPLRPLVPLFEKLGLLAVIAAVVLFRAQRQGR